MKHFTIEQVARICHEVLRRYGESIGDALPAWEMMQESRKGAFRNSVKAHILMLERGEEFDYQRAHDGWVLELLSQGWEQAPETDWDNKRHKALIPYAELAPEQRFKDYLMREMVATFWSGDKNGDIFPA